jgi:hypothetical protein
MRFQVLTTVNMKIRAFWDVAPCRLVSLENTDVLEVHTASTTVMMEAVSISHTSVYSNEITRRSRKALIFVREMGFEDRFWMELTQGRVLTPSDS